MSRAGWPSPSAGAQGHCSPKTRRGRSRHRQTPRTPPPGSGAENRGEGRTPICSGARCLVGPGQPAGGRGLGSDPGPARSPRARRAAHGPSSLPARPTLRGIFPAVRPRAPHRGPRPRPGGTPSPLAARSRPTAHSPRPRPQRPAHNIRPASGLRRPRGAKPRPPRTRTDLSRPPALRSSRLAGWRGPNGEPRPSISTPTRAHRPATSRAALAPE